jgi:hypothetical protein
MLIKLENEEKTLKTFESAIKATSFPEVSSQKITQEVLAASMINHDRSRMDLLEETKNLQ